MIFEISCVIKCIVFQISLKIKKKVFFGVFLYFGPKTSKNDKSCAKKTDKIIKLPFYLSHFIQKNPLFDTDLFLGPLTWNRPHMSGYSFP